MKTLSKSLATLIKRNHKWQKNIDPIFFSQHAQGQQPDILFIACSDSRVTPSIITKSDLGKLFVTRNVANLVVHSDQSMQAVVRYAVTHLQVKHIVICGHYGCGGVKAAMDIADSGSEIEIELSDWLKPVVELYNKNKGHLSLIENNTKRYKAFIKINVEQQLLNMSNLNPVKEACESPSQTSPIIHGAIYDLDNGQVKLVGANQESLKNELDEIIIKEQLKILSQKANSYNPFNFIGAQAKHQLISDALDSIKQNEELHISCELNRNGSNLYNALNHKRLLSFSFKGFNQSSWFSTKANSLLNIEAEENHVISEQMHCK